MQKERTKVIEFYQVPQQFLEELKSIPTRKLIHKRDKDLISKLKKWVREYWNDDGSMDLYESQYARLQSFLKDFDLL